jgi:hypothetical protein
MTIPRRVALALVGMVVVGAFAGAALAAGAEAVTLDGKIVCAKCALKKADAKTCQNVLVVAGPEGKDVEYYIEKNEAGATFGDVCTAVKKAVVTGTVSEKDGRKWIAASSIETKS